MNRWIRRSIATLALLTGFSLPASATSTGIDYTDIWWNPSESGWGVNFIEQGTFIFATMFVYGTDQKPTWYTGQMDSGGTTTFTGPLYATTGPYFGGGFDPHSVTVTQVGTMTANFSGGYSGTLTYTVNNVSVTKNIVRQFLKNNNIAGDYLGGMTANATVCHNGATNGAALIWGQLLVTQTGQNLSMVVNFYNGAGTPSTCKYSGVLAAQGVLGQIANGTFSCSVITSSGNVPSNAGTFNLDNISMTQSGFTGLFTGGDQYCTYNGYFGGVKDVL